MKKKEKNLEAEINDLYKKLKINVKQAEKNLEQYKNNNANCLYKNNYNISFINSTVKQKNELS